MGLIFVEGLEGESPDSRAPTITSAGHGLQRFGQRASRDSSKAGAQADEQRIGPSKGDRECSKSHAKGTDEFAVSVVQIAGQETGKHRQSSITATSATRLVESTLRTHRRRSTERVRALGESTFLLARGCRMEVTRTPVPGYRDLVRRTAMRTVFRQSEQKPPTYSNRTIRRATRRCSPAEKSYRDLGDDGHR
ncbi:hypothetical protein SAMN04490189_0942 [Pseudomonas koreensis]|nr:hypothetical protein SAMN04490189_0942 [Pseudomonas koreensis]